MRFVQTNSTLPGSVTLHSMQCATFTVSGYFTQSGSCFTMLPLLPHLLIQHGWIVFV
ncbi:MAG: hypothetical protein HS118_11265 [Bacteroidia bacterium]|nr:hypothetical protein [Bacteroidia bacterium]